MSATLQSDQACGLVKSDRKKAISQLGIPVIFCALVAYVAWCSRLFYLAPGDLNGSKLPPELRTIVPQLVQSSGMLRPEPFDGTRLRNLLLHPWSSDRQRLRIVELKPDLILVCRVDGVMMRGERLLFMRDATGWKHITEEEFETSEQAVSPAATR